MDLELAPERFGPAMRALNERQQKFVLYWLNHPKCTAAAAAKAAGYSDDAASVKVQGYRLRHDERVIAAIQEVSSQLLRTKGAVLGIGTIMRIAENDKHPDQLAAAKALADRSGFHGTTEHKVKVEHRDETGTAMVERIKKLAGLLGVDADKLLGVNAATPMLPGPVIEGEIVAPNE